MISSETLTTGFVASMLIYIHVNADPIRKPGSCDMHKEKCLAPLDYSLPIPPLTNADGIRTKNNTPSPSAPLNTPIGSGKGVRIKRTISYKCGSNQSIGKLYVKTNIKIMSNKMLKSKFIVHLTCFNRQMSVNMVKGYIDLIEINLHWSSVKVCPCFAIGH